MIGKTYRSVRRRTASLLNGILLPRFGIKLMRAHTKNFHYERLPSDEGGIAQVRVAGPNGAAIVSLRKGNSDWMTFEQIFINEDYDLRALTRYAELKRHYTAISQHGTPLIVDLGGNIGLSPLYFSLVWDGARIVAVEPDSDNFAMLTRNVSGTRQIEAIQAGVSSTGAALRIVDPSGPGNAHRTALAGGVVGEVPGITMQRILDEQRARGAIPFAVKVDIEGAESELFSANLEWIDHVPLIIVELHDWLYPGEGTARPFLAAMAARDRDFVYLDENVFSIANGLSIDMIKIGI